MTKNLLILLLFSSATTQAFASSQRQLPDHVKKTVLQIVESGISLHIARVEAKQAQEKVVISEIEDEIQSLLPMLPSSDFRYSHLRKVLTTLNDSIEMYQEGGKRPKRHLQNFFKELVEISKLYKVARYPVFFCSVDKSYWIQKSYRKGRNPVNPEKLLRCGRKV